MKKKIIFTIVILCFTQLFVNNNLYAQKNVRNNSVMKFENQNQDLGSFKISDTQTVVFKFKNIGTEPLVIYDWKSNAPWITVLNSRNSVILPGKTDAITLKLKTQYMGMFIKTVTVFTNARSGDEVLTIRGKAETGENN